MRFVHIGDDCIFYLSMRCHRFCVWDFFEGKAKVTFICDANGFFDFQRKKYLHFWRWNVHRWHLIKFLGDWHDNCDYPYVIKCRMLPHQHVFLNDLYLLTKWFLVIQVRLFPLFLYHKFFKMWVFLDLLWRLLMFKNWRKYYLVSVKIRKWRKRNNPIKGFNLMPKEIWSKKNWIWRNGHWLAKLNLVLLELFYLVCKITVFCDQKLYNYGWIK